MEMKDKFNTVHDDFFGNIVGTIVKTIKKSVSTPTDTDFVADWSVPAGTSRP